MDAPYAYEMRKWTQNEVVAGFESQFSCLKTTITIERSTKEVLGVEEPVNQTLPLCKDAENKIRRRGDEVPTSVIELFENLTREPPFGRPDNFP